MTTGKTIPLTIQTLSAKWCLCLAFLPRSKCLLIAWLQSPSAVILESNKIKPATVSIFCPPICHEVMGLDAMIFVFLMLSFKPVFSFFSFTHIKKLFSFSSLHAIRVVLSAYLRLWKISSGNLFLFLIVGDVFNNLFIYNWRIIALQYCVGICHISTWINHRYTYVPSILNFPPTSNPILLPAILIPVCDSSSPAFRMI